MLGQLGSVLSGTESTISMKDGLTPPSPANTPEPLFAPKGQLLFSEDPHTAIRMPQPKTQKLAVPQKIKHGITA